MKQRRSAFTLIELLVVIAIIAILAAILFPVFAQAKKAAKTTVALSNMKQIGLGLKMYAGDYDDTYPNRRFSNAPYVYSWKYSVYPYVKNAGIFTDPINPAAQYLDDTSDNAATFGLNGGAPPEPVGTPLFSRGYAMVNNFWLTGNWGGPGVPESVVPEVATIMQTMETQSVFVDYGPYISLCDGGPNDASRGCTGQESGESLGHTIPITWTGSGPNFGGIKTKGPKSHGSAISFYDGHAKVYSLGQYCNSDPTRLNAWGYIPNNLNGGYMGGANITWLDSWCQAARTDGE